MDEHRLHRAHRVVRRLARDRRPLVAGIVVDELRRLGYDGRAAVKALDAAGLIERGLTDGPLEESLVYPAGLRPAPEPVFEDMVVIVDESADRVVSLTWFDGRWTEHRHPAFEPDGRFEVLEAIDCAPPSRPDRALETLQEELAAVLFPPESTIPGDVDDVARSGGKVRIWLHATGDLALLPWEMAKHPATVRTGRRGSARGLEMLIEDESIVLVRTVGATRSAHRPADWLARPVEYVCLTPDRDDRAGFAAALALTSWAGAPVVLDAEDFLACRRRPDPGGILHLVWHEDGSRPHADLVRAVVAREPALAVLGGCGSGRDSAAAPALAREISLSGVPAVVGMLGTGGTDPQRRFTGAFYDSLELSIEAAVAAGRRLLGPQPWQAGQYVLFAHGPATTGGRGQERR